MKDELAKKLVELLTAAQNAGEEAFLFGKAYIPDIIHQLLVWKFAEAAVYTVFGIALLITSIVSFRKVEAAKDEEPWIMLGVISGITGVIFICCNFGDALQLWLAPKVYLLEYLRASLK